MKNLLLLLALALSSTLFSQTKKESPLPNSPKPKFSLSVIGGLNLSRMPYRYPESSADLLLPTTKTEYAFFGGLVARQPFSERWAMLLDAAFSVRGFGENIGQQQTRFRFDYLDLVPQAEYRAYRNLFLTMGAYVGFRTKEHVKFGEENWADVNAELLELAEDTDFGIVPGFALRFDRVSVLLRYQHGLACASYFDISNEQGQLVGTVERHNRTLQIGLGFKVL